MKKLILFLFAPLLMAQTASQAIQLPPGMEETLAIAPDASYLGDALKIQDCPDDKDNPLGLCNNVLFGGLAMYLTPLQGNIHIRFYPPVNNIANFEITHPGGLRGTDVVMRAPQFYRFPVTGTRLSDEARISTGQVNLATGEITTLDYRITPSNSWTQALGSLNPKLAVSDLRFPGVYGTAIGRFDQRPDGLLDFTLFASAFLPLGNNTGGDPVFIPLPFCSAPGVCRGMEAPGTSLHPRIRISTRPLDGAGCGSNCPDIPLNSTRVFTATSYYTSLGDRFHPDIPALGGDGFGRSHLQGRLNIQFGDRYDDLVPVSVWALEPAALLAVPPPSPLPGFSPSLIGHNEYLRFPNYTYQPKDVALVSDPFDFAVGALNVRTGEMLGDFVYRGFPAQDLFFAIQALNQGRIPADSFRWRGPASFERGNDGSAIFRFNSQLFLSFATFIFPVPDYNPAEGWRAGDKAELNPFLKFQATYSGQRPNILKSGQINEVSSFGDAISFNYSIPCDPANRNFSFDFTNPANATRGGTFHMKALASVTCTNSRGSAAGPGDADVLTFSGFGSWSKDSDTHLATVQISTSPGSRYWSVQIDGGLLSNANIKPPNETEP